MGTIYIEHRYYLSCHCLLSLRVLLNAAYFKIQYSYEHFANNASKVHMPYSLCIHNVDFTENQVKFP